MKRPPLSILWLLGATLVSGCSSIAFAPLERVLIQSKGSSVSNFISAIKLDSSEVSLTSLGFKGGLEAHPIKWQSITLPEQNKILNIFEVETLATDEEATNFFKSNNHCFLKLMGYDGAASHFRNLSLFPGSSYIVRVRVRVASPSRGYNYIETSRFSVDNTGILYIASSLPTQAGCQGAKSWLASVIDTTTHEAIHITNRLNSPAKSAISDEIIAYIGGICAARLIDGDFSSQAPFWINEENIWESKLPATYRAAYIAKNILKNPSNGDFCKTDYSREFLHLDEWHAISLAQRLMIAEK